MRKKTGSLTIIVLIVMTCLHILLCLCMYSSSMLFTLSKTKGDYEQLHHSAHGLSIYAVLESEKMIQNFLDSSSTKMTLARIPWPDGQNDYQGHVWIEKIKRKNKITPVIHTDIEFNKKIVISLKA